MLKKINPISKSILVLSSFILAASLTACGGSSSSSSSKKATINSERCANDPIPTLFTSIPAKKIVKTSELVVDGTKYEITSGDMESVDSLEPSQNGEFMTLSLDNGLLIAISLDKEREPVSRYIFIDDENNILGKGIARFVANNVVLQEQGSSYVINGTFDTMPSGSPIAVKITVDESLFGLGNSTFTFHENGTEAELNGVLGTKTFNDVVDILNTKPLVKHIVFNNVPGSMNDEVNMQTGLLLRSYKFTTYLPETGNIASGGVDLFIAGVTRTLEKGATVGVHSWQGGGIEASKLSATDACHNAQLAYFKHTLVDKGKDFYFFTINAAPAAGIHNMTEAEIEKFGLRTK
jgi:hypothetical protein